LRLFNIDEEMTEFLIGCGGWAYFHVPGLKPLDAYARAFNFVEVNSTFYKMPSLQLAKSWRQRVPRDFEFSVRCHKDVTHKYRLEPNNEALQTLNTMIEICGVLDSKFLVFETPSKMHYTHEKTESIRNLLESVNLKGVRMVWEIRRKEGEQIPSSVVALLQDYDIVHCVDLSKENPLKSDTIYTRLFGKGEHNLYQFTDNELTEVDRKITSRNPEKVAVSFHNVRMYKDAARYKIYRQTGKFSSVTGAQGQESLRKVLMEDAEFPATKNELIKSQGWKVIDLTGEIRVRAESLLERLPDKQFRNMEEVLLYAEEILRLS